MDAAYAWAILIFGLALPFAHVALSRDIGGRRETAPEGARGGGCPFSPRTGWLVIVLFLGPIGWLMFIHSRKKRRRMMARAAARNETI